MTAAPGKPNAPRAAPTLRTDTLADSVIILLALTVLQRLIGFGRAVLFCRWLDPDQLGQWDMAFSFLMLAAPLSVFSLSGSFGRYVEHFRTRQQLRTFLRRTAVFCAFLAVPAVLLIYTARQWFSQLIFGTPEQSELVAVLAVSLLAVVATNYFIDLFNALRNVRLIAALQLFNTVAFAVLAVGLLLFWRCTAATVVIAYGGATMLCALGALVWLRRSWRAFPENEGHLPQRELWSKVLPFVAWVLATSTLANLFAVVDRYMIIHFSAVPAAEALARVGDYHSSRVVPLLFVSVAMMLSTTATPHLSHEWETGQRERVAQRLNLIVKLLGLILFAAAVAVLLAAPLLFGVALKGKFAGGLAVLPWTLTYCIWFGMQAVCQNYLWCAEKARLASLALLIGLIANVGLNLLLLPRLGLLGAVLATTVANLLALVLICGFNHLLGFRLSFGAGVVLAMPITICFGPWLALAVLLAAVLQVVTSERLFSQAEKRQIADRYRVYAERFRGLLPTRKPAERGSG
ncbi:MAG: lipopolysaccharide biosynthesis protein [Pirellulales bacterium]|nr:lipopolysaccharide biosynthesis protein [Pirellulales bacterium]